jgi:hypothetical protein
LTIVQTKNKLFYSLKPLIKSHKGILILLTLSCVVAVNALIIFSSPDSTSVAIDLTAVLTSGAALFISVVSTLLKYISKRGGVGYFWCSIGLSFWFAAEVIWVYNRQIVGIDLPYPSIADGAWITGYGFFALHLYRIMRNIARTNPIEKSLVVLVSVAVSLSLGYVLNLTFGVADILGFREDVLSPIVSLSYPVLDGILIVPSMVILWSLRKGDPFSFHWLLLSVSFILLAMGDIGFGYSFGLAPDVAEEFEWIWALFYNSGYLCIATSVLYSLVINRFYNRVGIDKVILKP